MENNLNKQTAKIQKIKKKDSEWIQFLFFRILKIQTICEQVDVVVEVVVVGLVVVEQQHRNLSWKQPSWKRSLSCC